MRRGSRRLPSSSILSRFTWTKRPLRRACLKVFSASGWHTAAVSMRLLILGGLPFASGAVGLGGEIEWPRPTRPGDVLHVESEIVEIIPSRSKPQQGIVRVRNTTLNQNHEPVQIFTAKILAFKRP